MTTLLDAVVDDRACCRDVLLDHCHGTHVRHADEAEECTDADCQVEPEGHTHIVPCSAIEPECRCV